MNHYFTNNQNLQSNIQQINITILEKTYKLYSDNGVFSKAGLDFGTRILIESLPFSQMTGKVLDVGCGYGPIGIVIKKETTSEVDMIDINRRALHLARMNANENNAVVNIFESDAYQNVKDSYNFIVTNPPIRAGKKKVYEILIGAHNLLKENGQLWFVMRKDHGVKSTLDDIKGYYNLEIKCRKKGFFVVCATKQAKNIDIT